MLNKKAPIRCSFLILLFFISVIVNVNFAPKFEGLSGWELLGYTTLAPNIKALNGWDDARFRKIEGEDDLVFAIRLNKNIYNSYWHCNYKSIRSGVEFIASKISSDSFLSVGFLSPERGCGWCHQAAYILAKALVQNKIKAYPLGLNGHVVVKAIINDKELIFDPDYGVGPLPYKDNLGGIIRESYPSELKYDNRLIEPLYIAYATKADDIPYFSMEILDEFERNQRLIINIVKFITMTIGFCSFILFIYSCGILRRRF